MATKPKLGRPPTMKNRTSLNVYLEASQKRKLERLAKREGRSMGELVREYVTMIAG